MEVLFWPLKRNNLFLIPGNSPAGLRLPLESLPQKSPETENLYELSPLDDPDSLPDPDSYLKSSGSSSIEVSSLKTALCVEAREGNLYIFMPPLKSLEAYVELCYHLEQVAKAVQIPIIIEGYHPPHDIRLENWL